MLKHRVLAAIFLILYLPSEKLPNVEVSQIKG